MRRPPLSRTLRVALALLLCSVAAVACGGGGGGKATSTPPGGSTPSGTASATLQQYFQQVQALDDAASAKLDALQSRLRPDLTEEEGLDVVRDSIADQGTILGELRDGLQQLSPPAEVETAHQGAIDALTAFVEFSQQASELAQAAPSVVDVAAILQSDDAQAANAGLTNACQALQQAAGTHGVALALSCGE